MRLCLALLFLVQAAAADTQLLFAKDGSKATVLFLALSTNPDAVQLYQTLTAPEQDMNGKRTKKFQFHDDQGVDAVDTVCAFSRIVASTGSCTLTLHLSRGLQMDPARQRMMYQVSGPEAARLASEFVLGPLDQVMVSSDRHFSIQVTRDSGAQVSALAIEYH
jgi:hypothetical protein